MYPWRLGMQRSGIGAFRVRKTLTQIVFEIFFLKYKLFCNILADLQPPSLCQTGLNPRKIYLRSTISAVGGARAWAVLLAKTSRTAVPTAIMPIIAGGRLYKCLYKMHVDSRAFWGAFWGAFRVFLIDVG